MQTVTIDILNNKAEKLLEDLEHLQLIRVRKDNHRSPTIINWAAKYKDSDKGQSLNSSQENEQHIKRK